MMGGDLCIRTMCAAITCGRAGRIMLYDTEEEILEPYEVIETTHEGWWIWRKPIVTKTTKERTYRVRHFNKELTYSYISCSHHQGTNLGIKIEINDVDNKDKTPIMDGGWLITSYVEEIPFSKLDEQLDELRNSINKDCIYDTLIGTKIGENNE